MTKNIFAITVLLLSALAHAQPAPAGTTPEVIERVYKAGGGENWSKVKRLKFTFNVEEGGTLKLSARHDWDVSAGTDTVTWGDKTVTVRLADAASAADKDQAAAFQRWTNDSYWLLMPLKLKDGGVRFGPVTSGGPDRANVTMSFAGVGLTPGDQYDLSIDTRTDRVVHWVYRPGADKKLAFAWDAYQTFGPLTLATDHKSDDGARRIYFTDVSAE
ncbi:MAG TPA: hypothetical protein VF624_19165 [Tepidisphaeraceae bacterium]